MYGVKTGFNQAFLLDTVTRDRLVAEHSSAAEVIRPYLRGQDVARWHCPDNGLWMIFARRGIAIDAYPSVKRYLETYRARLQPQPDDWEPRHPAEKWTGRKRGTYAWFELQDAVDYWQEFSKPKIIYKVIQFHPSYAFDDEGRLGNDKTFIIPSNDLSLLAILNSPLMWWFNWRHLTHLKDEALSPMGYKMERLPIAQFTPAARDSGTQLVQRLIDETKAVTAATVSLQDWVRLRFDIAKPPRVLSNPDRLTLETFVASIQTALLRRSRLSGGDIADIKREHGATVEPTRAARGRIFALEQEISQLVNSAYGLTSAEVALMWNTAPPRMPFTLQGLADDDATTNGANGEDDDSAT